METGSDINMVRRCTAEDIPMVNRIMGDESVYPWISDDGVDPGIRHRLGEIFIGSESIYVLSTNEHTAFVLVPRNSFTYEVHTNILPGGRGRMALESCRAVAEWMFGKTRCLKVETTVPENNRAARMLARRTGFVIEGLSESSYVKNGTIYNQTLMGLTKEAWECQQQQQ